MLRLTYFKGFSQDSVSKLLGVVPRTMRRIKKEAVMKLAEMYAFTKKSMK